LKSLAQPHSGIKAYQSVPQRRRGRIDAYQTAAGFFMNG